MSDRVPGFVGEYLWELEMAGRQLVALAEAVPEERYGWRPAEGLRSFSAILVHIAAANFGLLKVAGSHLPECHDLYGNLRTAEPAHMAAMILKNRSLEQSVNGKQVVAGFLRRSLEAVRESITATADLEQPVVFFGETTTVRRVFLRMLAHSNEHLGQAVAYVRAAGGELPWPDPVRDLERAMAGSSN